MKKTVLFVSHSRDEVYHLCPSRLCAGKRAYGDGAGEKRVFCQSADRGCRADFRLPESVQGQTPVRHTLYAEDWNIPFRLEQRIPEDLAWVGIRAHYIEVDEGTEMDLPRDGEDRTAGKENRTDKRENTAVLKVSHLLEQQFESELVLDCTPEKTAQIRDTDGKGTGRTAFTQGKRSHPDSGRRTAFAAGIGKRGRNTEILCGKPGKTAGKLYIRTKTSGIWIAGGILIFIINKMQEKSGKFCLQRIPFLPASG